MDSIKDVITPVEKLIANQTFTKARTNFDLKFIEKQKQNSSHIFDMSITKKRKADVSNQKSTTKKQKADEMVCKFYSRLFFKYLYLLSCENADEIDTQC